MEIVSLQRDHVWWFSWQGKCMAPVLVMQLTVYKEKVPAISFCPGNFCMWAVSGCFQFLSWSLLRVNTVVVYLGGKESTYSFHSILWAPCRKKACISFLSWHFLCGRYCWTSSVVSWAFPGVEVMRWHVFWEGECIASDLVVQFRGWNGKAQMSKSWLFTFPRCHPKTPLDGGMHLPNNLSVPWSSPNTSPAPKMKKLDKCSHTGARIERCWWSSVSHCSS